MSQINHILLLLIFSSFPTWTPILSLHGSIFLPTLLQYHEPFISSTLSFPICEPTFISPTSYRNSPMGPPPFVSLPNTLCPPWATHLTLGHPFLYLYISPQNYSLFIVQTPLFPVISLSFCRHLWRLAYFLLATRNPCHPWLEHYLSSTLAGIVHIFRVIHRSLTFTL
jgi:hypothetical protein